MRNIKFVLILILSILMLTCKTKPIPYDLSFLKENLNEAAREHKFLIVIFGASWCPDCNALDRMLNEDKIKALVDREFIILKVDVGRFDKNLEINEKLGDPIDNGIPALVIMDPQKKEPVIANTIGGEFSSASRMSSDQVFKYLSKFSESKDKL